MQDRKEFDELKEVCYPIIKLLKDRYHPHITVEISENGIKVNETTIFIPLDK